MADTMVGLTDRANCAFSADVGAISRHLRDGLTTPDGAFAAVKVAWDDRQRELARIALLYECGSCDGTGHELDDEDPLLRRLPWVDDGERPPVCVACGGAGLVAKPCACGEPAVCTVGGVPLCQECLSGTK